jgi:hypothetical protein
MDASSFPAGAQAARDRGPSDSAPQAAQRPNKRQQAKARTRQKVLDAARTLFEAGGYQAATIRDIAKGAGMSTGAVFANFECKADIWRAVFHGPPPSPALADEIARVQALPGCSFWIRGAGDGGFAVSVEETLDSAGLNRVRWRESGTDLVALLRKVRTEAAAHAVRHGEAA